MNKAPFLLITSVITSVFTCSLLSNHVKAAISYGELVDKITILTIKSERISNAAQLKNIMTELAILKQLFDEYIGNRPDIVSLIGPLKHFNEIIWKAEDIVRAKELAQEFDNEFIESARTIYAANDKRSLVKRKIDVLCNSSLCEEKSYENLYQEDISEQIND